eukprot:4686644-Prymnesium_polylepis.1
MSLRDSITKRRCSPAVRAAATTVSAPKSSRSWKGSTSASRFGGRRGSSAAITRAPGAPQPPPLRWNSCSGGTAGRRMRSRS